MDKVEKQHMHALFTAKDYMELYRTQKPTVDLMLGIKEQWEFEDLLEDENSIEEASVWLYYPVVQGDVLEIGGYAEFHRIADHLRDIYVDIDERDNLEERIGLCNQRLAGTGYSIQVEHDDAYCAWDYFLSVQHT